MVQPEQPMGLDAWHVDGGKQYRVKTHAVAIQLVELSAFRSLPILAYCNSSGVSLITTGREEKG